MIRKLAEEAVIGDSFAQKMTEVLSKPEHQKLFKKAETVCKCAKECECTGEKCICKGQCLSTCPSCGKDKTVEAANKVIQDLINVSATLDDFGYEKQASQVLRLAQIYSRKLAKEDSNDIKMKDLGIGGYSGAPGHLSEEIEELESDPSYMEWAKDPKFHAHVARRDRPRTPYGIDPYLTDLALRDMPPPEDPGYDVKFDEFNEDELNADDKDLVSLLEEDEDPPTSPKPWEELPEIERFPDTEIPDTEPANTIPSPRRDELSLKRDTNIDDLLDEPIDFSGDEFAPDTEFDDFEMDARHPKWGPETMRSHDLDLDLIEAFERTDQYFKKLAKIEEIEEDEEDDFEDE